MTTIALRLLSPERQPTRTRGLADAAAVGQMAILHRQQLVKKCFQRFDVTLQERGVTGSILRKKMRESASGFG
jgi:hypothetical protein